MLPRAIEGETLGLQLQKNIKVVWIMFKTVKKENLITILPVVIILVHKTLLFPSLFFLDLECYHYLSYYPPSLSLYVSIYYMYLFLPLLNFSLSPPFLILPFLHCCFLRFGRLTNWFLSLSLSLHLRFQIWFSFFLSWSLY